MTLRTYYPTPEPTFAPPPGPDRTDGLLWGHTVRDLDRAARTAVVAARTAMDSHTAYDLAWEGIVLCLAETDQAPTHAYLVTAGWRAIYAEIRQGNRMRGIPETDRGYDLVNTPRFAQYWTRRCAPSHEEGIVERLALGQVLPTLSDTQMRGLAALASTGDYQAAADLLGIDYRALVARIGYARKRFVDSWFEHETPPKRRHTDRRVSSRAPASTHCPSGHEWTPENTRWAVRTVNGTLRRGRRCRACQSDRDIGRRRK